jgi:hypothetical protein
MGDVLYAILRSVVSFRVKVMKPAFVTRHDSVKKVVAVDSIPFQELGRNNFSPKSLLSSQQARHSPGTNVAVTFPWLTHRYSLTNSSICLGMIVDVCVPLYTILYSLTLPAFLRCGDFLVNEKFYHCSSPKRPLLAKPFFRTEKLPMTGAGGVIFILVWHERWKY